MRRSATPSGSRVGRGGAGRRPPVGDAAPRPRGGTRRVGSNFLRTCGSTSASSRPADGGVSGRVPPPVPRVVLRGVAPHAALGTLRLQLHAPVAFAVGGDGIAVANEPFAHVLAVAGHGAEDALVPVVSLDGDPDDLPADLLYQRALDALSLPEPVALLVLCYLIHLRRIETGEAYGLPGYPDGVAVDDEGLSINGVSGAKCPVSGGSAAPSPAQRDREKRSNDDYGNKFHIRGPTHLPAAAAQAGPGALLPGCLVLILFPSEARRKRKVAAGKSGRRG